jgi:hypothetical protein
VGSDETSRLKLTSASVISAETEALLRECYAVCSIFPAIALTYLINFSEIGSFFFFFLRSQQLAVGY